MSKKRVLIAVDNELSLETLVACLRLEGHTVVAVSDGEMAWTLLASGEEFDFIMSDYQMPYVDGIELLRRVRGNSRIAGTPFVLMSGDVEIPEELNKVCQRLGATFVEKPFDFLEFIKRVLGSGRK